jgi:ATP-binding cassette subfamily G (WHITE) protein 2 (SNQ2)
MSSGAEKQRSWSPARSDPATAVPSRAPSDVIEMSVPEKNRGERDGVNVHDAEAEFNALARRLTRQSTRHNEKDESVDDVEKQETFDLLDYLRSTSGKQDDAGFAHKHVGVTFQNLRVIGAGGVKICKSIPVFFVGVHSYRK